MGGIRVVTLLVGMIVSGSRLSSNYYVVLIIIIIDMLQISNLA